LPADRTEASGKRDLDFRSPRLVSAMPDFSIEGGGFTAAGVLGLEAPLAM
jgi:hypothetical protein